MFPPKNKYPTSAATLLNFNRFYKLFTDRLSKRFAMQRYVDVPPYVYLKYDFELGHGYVAYCVQVGPKK